MAQTQPVQSFSQHARWDPAFHFFAAPIFAITFFLAVSRAIRHPTPWNLWTVAFAAAAVVALFTMRMYSLKVQDRIIRLEERLRLSELSQAGPRTVPELSPRQWVALRFASDGEVLDLARRASQENLSSKQIKEAIRTWRPDHFRV